jgi:hypothetical protein
MSQAQAKPPGSVSIKAFLESVPPGKTVWLADKVGSQVTGMHGLTTSFYYDLPEIELHCDDCDGPRLFSSEDAKWWYRGSSEHFLIYTCKNCERTRKVYAVLLQNKTTEAQKIGEWPSFGPPTPARVITLIGPDRDNFLKGRRSENQGLGIGAFAYYRRIVEDQKDRIFDELIRACKKLGASEDIVKDLEKAKKETQFTTAVDVVKHGLPESLLLDGRHNPLTLLHAALSTGLHGKSDEECLDIAQQIRVVLTELAERVAQVLAKRSELDSAVSKLMQHGSKEKS